MSNRILVLGATGTIGETLVNLIKEKAEVTVFVRDAAKATKAFGQSVKVAIGDSEKVETVEAALKAGFDRLFLLTNSPARVEPKIAALAKAAGVKQLVKLS